MKGQDLCIWRNDDDGADGTIELDGYLFRFWYLKKTKEVYRLESMLSVHWSLDRKYDGRGWLLKGCNIVEKLIQRAIV